MGSSAFFLATCSHCRRATEFQIVKLGRSVSCRHCGDAFVAADSSSQSAALDDPLNYWIQFTDHEFKNETFDNVEQPDITRNPR